ncbi:hypothetical protein TRVA0_036S00782 [Trichomonascus vanleenenianus]|uniref:uncharacterized protein n=1 Tax=Trichomonascus vanleenenianus TaxID=2268995 RepID=UPI003ECB9D53
MKFTTTFTALAMAGASVAAPAENDKSVKEDLSIPGLPAISDLPNLPLPLPLPVIPGLPDLTPFSGSAQGTVSCDLITKICTIPCGDNLSEVCSIVGLVDSALVSVEALLGFSVICLNNNCAVFCNPLLAVTCPLVGLIGSVDQTLFSTETIILSDVDGLLGDLLSDASPISLGS